MNLSFIVLILPDRYTLTGRKLIVYILFGLC